MILMIDNYDSFVYNLVQYIGELGEEVLVKRNDEITIEEIKELDPEIIVLSPGPCSPKESGICIDVVNNFKGIKPILGICLGHQTIGHVFGGNVIKANQPVHGKVHSIKQVFFIIHVIFYRYYHIFLITNSIHQKRSFFLFSFSITYLTTF